MRTSQILPQKIQLISNRNSQTGSDLYFGIWCLFIIWCLEFCVCSSSATAGENIRVAIADNLKSVAIKSSAGLIMEGPAVPIPEKKIIFTSGTMGSLPARVSTSGEFLQVNGKSYRGSVEVRKKERASPGHQPAGYRGLSERGGCLRNTP